MASKKYTLSLLYEIDDVEQSKTEIYEYEVDLTTIDIEAVAESLLGLVPASLATRIGSLSQYNGIVETLLSRAGLI